jgi:replicative DNA helicase
METRELPYSDELEQALLGSCLVDPQAYRQAEGITSEADFKIAKNRWVWRALGSLHARGEPPDFVILVDELEREDKLTEVGGATYVTRLVNAVPSAYRVRYYAARVAELAERRRTIHSASELVQAAFNLNGDFKVEKARLASRILHDSPAGNGTTPVADAVREVFGAVEHNVANPLEPGQVRYLSTGLRGLDDLTGGLCPALHVVAAVTHTGKTALCLAIAANVARAGNKVLYVSPEMTPSQLIERMACAQARVDSRDLDSGRIAENDDAMARFVRTMGQIAEWPLIISQAHSMSEIQAQVYAESPLALIVLDGIELVTGAGNDRTHEARGEVSRWAMNLAVEPDVCAPILLPGQIAIKQVMARADRRPQPGDFYHSSEPDYITDVMLTLHRHDRWIVDKTKTPPNRELEVVIWKHRIKRRDIPNRRVLYYGDCGDIGDLAYEPAPLAF